MAVSLLRVPSDTANILNYHDCRALRFAYSSDGIVPKVGNECSSSITGNTLHINTGELVLQGWQVEIDGIGVDVTLPVPSSGSYYISVYLYVDLRTSGSQKAEIKTSSSSSSYPTISTVDLTRYPTSAGSLLLYQILMNSDGTSTKIDKVEKIKYTDEKIAEMQKLLQDKITALSSRVSILESAKRVAHNLIINFEGGTAYSTIFSSDETQITKSNIYTKSGESKRPATGVVKLGDATYEIVAFSRFSSGAVTIYYKVSTGENSRNLTLNSVVDNRDYL